MTRSQRIEDDIRRFAHAYLAKPLVLVTFAVRASTSAASGLDALAETPEYTQDNAMNHVGIPRVVNDFILVPHIDPGRDKYSHQYASQRRIYVICHMITLDIVRRVTTPGVTAAPQDIVDRWTEENPVLLSKLAAAKRELQLNWCGSSPVVRQKLLQGNPERNALLRYAKSDIGDRDTQASDLWRQNYRDLHYIINRDLPSEWFDFNTNVAVGQSFKLTVWQTLLLVITQVRTCGV